MPPPTLPSNATARPASRAQGEDRLAVLGEEGLVGRDHVLARGQGLGHELQGRIRAPHGLDDDVNLGIIDEAAGVGRHADPVESHAARLIGVADGGPLPMDRTAGAAGQSSGMLGQQPRHAGPHRTQPDQANRDVFHVVSSFMASIRGAGSSRPSPGSRVRLAPCGVQPEVNLSCRLPVLRRPTQGERPRPAGREDSSGADAMALRNVEGR